MILNDQKRYLAIQDEIADHTAIRPLVFPRIPMRTQCNQIDLFLLHHLMQCFSCVVAGNEVGLNINAFQIRTRLHLFKIMPGFFSDFARQRDWLDRYLRGPGAFGAPFPGFAPHAQDESLAVWTWRQLHHNWQNMFCSLGTIQRYQNALVKRDV